MDRNQCDHGCRITSLLYSFSEKQLKSVAANHKQWECSEPSHYNLESSFTLVEVKLNGIGNEVTNIHVVLKGWLTDIFI